MKFTNLTSDTLVIPSLFLQVAPSEQTPDLPDEVAAGFIEQTDIWGQVGEKKPAKKATAKKAAPPKMPEPNPSPDVPDDAPADEPTQDPTAEEK